MSKLAGPLVLSAALLGVVGGGVYAGAHAFAPVTHETPKVELVQPAAQTVTPTVDAAAKAKAAAAAKTKAAALAKKKAAAAAAKKAAAQRAAVNSTQQKSTTTQQRQAVVSEQPAEPQPTDPPAATAPLGPPPAIGGSGTYQCGPSGCTTPEPGN